MGTLKWVFDTSGPVVSSPAIAEDGTIFVASDDAFFYAIWPNGTEKWRIPIANFSHSSPSIAPNGTVYLGTGDQLYAMNPDGTIEWKYSFGGNISIYSSPTVGRDGTIYIGYQDHEIYAINSDRTLKWNYTTGNYVLSTAAIAVDGTIYIGSYDHHLYALYPDGTLKWNYETSGLVLSSPAIGSDGTIYVGSGYNNGFYALYPNGSLKWELHEFTDGNFVSSSPAIGVDGTLYVGARDHHLYAIHPNGSVKWRFKTDGWVTSSPALGSDGTIYFGSRDNSVYALYPNGSLKWEYKTGGWVYSSPAIGADGTIYVGSDDGSLYAFGQQVQGPVANAGPDQTINEGDMVHFDGTGSHSQGENEGVWTLKTDAPAPMTGAASTTLNDEIYLIGGDTIDCIAGPTSIVQRYNPSSDSWSRLPDLPAERVYLGAATTNGKIYAIGGSDGNLSTNTTFEFDPITNNWTAKAPLPIWMEAFGTAVANDRIYVVGGWSTFMYCYPCGMVFEYDPSADSWSTKPDLPTPRAYLAAVGLEDKIHAIGGDARESVNTVEAYDPITEKWTKRANMTTNRSYLSAEALGGNIYAFGGAETSGPPLNSTEMYDPSEDRWIHKSPMIEAKVSPGSGVVGNCLYSAGGYGGISPISSNEEYCLDGELTYEWDFDASVDSDGDGINTNDKEATGPTPTHVYYDDGVYTVTLTVRDTQGLQDTDQCNITVLNVPPTPEWTSRSVDGSILNPPYPEGKEILFEATVYDPGVYDTFNYDWDFGDGTILLDAGPSVVHAYGDNDTYIVVLRVTDDDGGVGMDSTPPLLTTNEDPVASISIPRCPIFEGGPACPVDGFFTDPGWLDTHSAAWDFGDGEYEIAVITEENEPPDATGMNSTSHVYGDNGVYNITFTVVDDDGGTDTALAWVSPYNLPPSITVDIPSLVKEGEHINIGITATDPGSDDLFIDIDWGDGTSESKTYYNNGVGPDPPNSGPGVFPFRIHANFSHVYGDDGDFTIAVRVEDDDGGLALNETIIVVENVPPTIDHFDYFFNVSLSFRLAGEKWHNVEFHLFEDGTEIGYANITRHPGSPDDQMAHLTDVSIDFSKRYSAIAYYTPKDDPINGQIWGATPAWVIMSYDDGSEERMHHTFNVRHEETWTWTIDDFSLYFLGHNITFVATASDPGSDDLIFNWDWGDGTSTEHIYYNNGMSPDSYPSPEVNPIIIADKAIHSYVSVGTYSVTLTVTDDDGGQVTVSIVLSI
jgi:outer membrane protein assembly factor BamB/PKD repeat protein